MDIDEELDKLRKTPTPQQSLSYQDIMNKIAQVHQERAPKAMVVAAVLVLSILLSFNFMSFKSQEQTRGNNLVNELGLMNNLSIYGGI